jgi:hypothetical protein
LVVAVMVVAGMGVTLRDVYAKWHIYLTPPPPMPIEML